jgi:hypothetical protein
VSALRCSSEWLYLSQTAFPLDSVWPDESATMHSGIAGVSVARLHMRQCVMVFACSFSYVLLARTSAPLKTQIDDHASAAVLLVLVAVPNAQSQ